jgi:hypothetical protein
VAIPNSHGLALSASAQNARRRSNATVNVSDARPATEPDADRVTELVTLALYDDPTWSWTFPAPDTRMQHHRIWWDLLMHSALPYGLFG